jgi:hypothetical protein
MESDARTLPIGTVVSFDRSAARAEPIQPYSPYDYSYPFIERSVLFR